MNATEAYALSKSYTNKTVIGLGALKGAPCTIKSIADNKDGTHTIVFEWTGNDGTKQETPLIVKDGEKGEYFIPMASATSLLSNETPTATVTVDEETMTATFNFGIPKGEKGAVYTPNVDKNGNLSWSNNGGLVNPATINIKGEKGERGADGLPGAQGIQGIQGEKGEKGDKGDIGAQGIQGVQGEKGEQGEQGIQGIQGERGADGYPFLIYKQYENGLEEFNADDFPEIGLMFMVHVYEEDKGFPIYRYTGEGNSPYSLITYLNSEGIKGDKGEQGEQGIQGIAGVDGKTYTPAIGTVSNLPEGSNATANISLDEENQQAIFSFGIPIGKSGENGKNGDTYIPAIGTVTSLPSDSDAVASVTIDEVNKKVIFNFGIPQGQKGKDGNVITDTELNSQSSNPIANYAVKNETDSIRSIANQNAESLSLLNGTGEGSVKKTVADEVAKIVADAPEDFDTLKEISDWIANHPEDTATMNSQIQRNTANISDLQIDKAEKSETVSTVANQQLTEEQKTNARENIGIDEVVTDYEDLDNLPQIEGVELTGNQTLEDFGGAKVWKGTMEDFEKLENIPDNGTLICISDDYQNDGYTRQEIDTMLGKVSAVLVENAPINLLQNQKDIGYTETKNGITATINDDWTITFDGTATEDYIMSVATWIKLRGNLFLSGCPTGGSQESYYMSVQGFSAEDVLAIDIGHGAEILTSTKSCFVYIHIKRGTVMNDLTFQPMICDVALRNYEYEPYYPTNLELGERVGDLEKNSEILDIVSHKIDILENEMDDKASMSDVADQVDFVDDKVEALSGKVDEGLESMSEKASQESVQDMEERIDGKIIGLSAAITDILSSLEDLELRVSALENA